MCACAYECMSNLVSAIEDWRVEWAPLSRDVKEPCSYYGEGKSQSLELGYSAATQPTSLIEAVAAMLCITCITSVLEISEGYSRRWEKRRVRCWHSSLYGPWHRTEQSQSRNLAVTSVAT